MIEGHVRRPGSHACTILAEASPVPHPMSSLPPSARCSTSASAILLGLVLSTPKALQYWLSL